MVNVLEVLVVTRQATRSASIATAVTSERATVAAMMRTRKPVSAATAMVRTMIVAASEVTVMMRITTEPASEAAAVMKTTIKEAGEAEAGVEVAAEALVQMGVQVVAGAEVVVVVKVEVAVVVGASQRTRMPSLEVMIVINCTKRELILYTRFVGPLYSVSLATDCMAAQLVI